jgi:hypothetical protein
MHAGHRLERDLRVFRRPGIIAIDAQPMHDALVEHQILADHRYIVFGLTGDDTGLAADAGIQIDRHCPGVLWIAITGIKRFLVSLLLEKMRVLLIFGERALMDQIAPGNAVMPLRRGEAQCIAGFAESDLPDPWRVGGAQLVRIEAGIDTEPAGSPAEAERQGDAVGRLPRQNKKRRPHAVPVGPDRQHVLGLDAEPGRSCRRDQRRIVPGQAGERARHLQQPGVIGKPAVPNQQVGTEKHGDCGFGRH